MPPPDPKQQQTQKPPETKPQEQLTEKPPIDVAEMMARMDPQAMAFIMTMMRMVQGQGATTQQVGGRREPVFFEKCVDCGQAVKACKGEHEMMVVFPTAYRAAWKAFAGVKINGKLYRSRSPQHRVLVPKCAKDAINARLTAFGLGEEDARIGKRTRLLNDNSWGAQKLRDALPDIR